ncbi:MAG TPA: hemolysin III family protein, partial [Deltaproteobacteria bacterium]|nr:hemolysin III family protein [Deltaproteobacteria bacterium]
MVHVLREPINGLTHCIGALLACAGLVVLIIKA